MRRLILFDIDGTLLVTGGRAGRVLGHALTEVFGSAGPIARTRFTGKTDPQIVFELMAAHGLPRATVAARIDAVFELYLAGLERELTPDTVTVLPGVRPLLAALGGRDDVRLGLLTGNIRGGAAVKLRAARLDHSFQVGAYGSDDEERDRLVPIARRRAAEYWGEEFAPADTLVIGDAPADIRCARAGDARVVAVATGGTTMDELARFAPDALLPGLDSPLVLNRLLAL